MASSGIIGGISGEWRNRRGGQLDQHIRLDLALYPGFSGGPLLNARGEVVGINTRGLAHGRAVTVPAATVNRVVEELLEKGHIARPYLGIAMQPVEVPENMRSKLPAQTRVGLLVMHVENGGPAEKAGVLLGDVLFEVGGETVEHVDAIQDSLATAKIGDVLQIRVIRAGEIKPVSISSRRKSTITNVEAKRWRRDPNCGGGDLRRPPGRTRKHHPQPRRLPPGGKFWRRGEPGVICP